MRGKKKVNMFWVSFLLIPMCNNTVLEYVTFDVPGWIEQNSSPSQRQNARELKIPSVSWVFWPLICKPIFSRSVFWQLFNEELLKHSLCPWLFLPKYFLAPTHTVKKNNFITKEHHEKHWRHHFIPKQQYHSYKNILVHHRYPVILQTSIEGWFHIWGLC